MKKKPKRPSAPKEWASSARQRARWTQQRREASRYDPAERFAVELIDVAAALDVDVVFTSADLQAELGVTGTTLQNYRSGYRYDDDPEPLLVEGVHYVRVRPSFIVYTEEAIEVIRDFQRYGDRRRRATKPSPAPATLQMTGRMFSPFEEESRRLVEQQKAKWRDRKPFDPPIDGIIILP